MLDLLAEDKQGLRIFGKKEGVAQNYVMLESCFSAFVGYKIDIQGIQYGSRSGSPGLRLGARENLQSLQTSKILQTIAGAANNVQDENSNGQK